MNSHRDNVKDAIQAVIDNNILLEEHCIDEELKYKLTDAVFDALGITEQEQDSSEKFAVRVGRHCTDCHCSLNSNERDWEGRCADCHNLELANGIIKFSVEDFEWFASKGAQSQDDPDKWYISIQTPICKYGQRYANMTWKEAVDKFIEFYYPLYERDYETAQKDEYGEPIDA